MKYFFYLLVFSALSISSAYAGQTVLVSVFDDRTETNISLGERARDGISTVLHRLPHIDLVDRSKMDLMMNEIQFSKSGLADTSKAAEFGRMLGAELVVMGSVSNSSFSLQEQKPLFSDETVIVGSGKTTITVSMVEVETQKIVFSETFTGEATGETNYQAVLPQAIDNAVIEIAMALQTKFVVKGYVIGLENKGKKYYAYLDIGRNFGASKGQKVKIYGPDKVFIHPVTKKEKRIPQELFEVKLSSVQDDSAIIKLKKKQYEQLVAGHVVQLVPQKGKKGGGFQMFDVKSISGMFNKLKD